MRPAYFDEDEFENDGMFPPVGDVPDDMLPDDDDMFSPTSWDKDPFETDEEYEERIKDQEDMMEYYDD